MSKHQQIAASLDGILQRSRIVDEDGLILENELVERAGVESVNQINSRAADALSVFSNEPDALSTDAAQNICDLTRQCLALGIAAGISSTASCGLVCEALAAASALLLEDEAAEERASAVALLEPVAEAMDSFAIEIFAGLTRLEELLQPRWNLLGSGQGGHLVFGAVLAAEERGDEMSYYEEVELYRALHGVCLWSLVFAVRSVGYSNFTARFLWEYAGGGALGVLMFSKGALCFEPDAQSFDEPVIYASSVGIRAPHDLMPVRDVILGAVLGLVSQDVAFASCKDAEDGSIDIEIRNAALRTHHAKLASCAEQSGLLECLLAYPWAVLPDAPRHLAALVEILAALGSAWVDRPPMLVRSLDAWKQQLSVYSAELWSIVEALSGSFSCGRGFLRSCAALAFAAPPQAEAAASFLQRCLGQDSGASTADPLALAALVAFATNAGRAPESGDPLTEVLCHLSGEVREDVLARLDSWRGPLKPESGASFALWKGLFQTGGQAHLQDNAEGVIGSCAAVSPAEEEHVTASGAGLRELVENAPAEFCCALDGRLLVDPVRCPSGHLCERSVLARTLKAARGQCPFTGSALQLADCPRDAGLRLRALQWVRSSRPRPPAPAVFLRP